MSFVNIAAANQLPTDSANTTDTPDAVVAKLAAFAAHFASVPDPREYRTPIHPLTNVLVIGLCAKHFTQMGDVYTFLAPARRGARKTPGQADRKMKAIFGGPCGHLTTERGLW